MWDQIIGVGYYMVATLFIFSGISKLLDSEGFLLTLHGIPYIKRSLIKVVSRSLPGLEILSGIGILFSYDVGIFCRMFNAYSFCFNNSFGDKEKPSSTL